MSMNFHRLWTNIQEDLKKMTTKYCSYKHSEVKDIVINWAMQMLLKKVKLYFKCRKEFACHISSICRIFCCCKIENATQVNTKIFFLYLQLFTYKYRWILSVLLYYCIIKSPKNDWAIKLNVILHYIILEYIHFL